MTYINDIKVELEQQLTSPMIYVSNCKLMGGRIKEASGRAIYIIAKTVGLLHSAC